MVADQRGQGSAPGPLSDGESGSSDRRQQILATAQRLFASQGYRETKLADVATELGIRRQAVYHYFRSKDEILYELIGLAGSAISTSAAPTLDSEGQADEILAAVIANHVRGLLAAPDVFRIQFAELSKLEGDRAEELRADIERYVRRVADVIASGQQQGIFADGPPMALALLVIGMCNFALEWQTADSRLSEEEVADLCVRTALLGVAAQRHAE